MGCATSKNRRPPCRNCRAPVARSYTMQVYHPPQQEGDTYHVVALTSSTLGSLDLNSIKFDEDPPIKEESTAVIEAKKWSAMIEEKIPKVTIHPETINVWELMAGLEENSPIRPPHHHQKSFSFHVNRDSIPSFCDSPLSKLNENCDDRSNSSISELDSVGYSDLSDSIEDEKKQALASNDKLINDDSIDYNLNGIFSKKKERVVLYFTSLRVVRKTYEDCCHVRVILKGIGVRIDERDISMHSGFKEELKELLGEGYFGNLPRVFAGKKYIGGVEVIRILHEEGNLEKVLEGCEMDDSSGVCEACGDVRFVSCDTCWGSCKIYYQGDFEDEEQCDDDDFGFRRCPDCNENGLVRCLICSN